jgi:hypothetical protein
MYSRWQAQRLHLPGQGYTSSLYYCNLASWVTSLYRMPLFLLNDSICTLSINHLFSSIKKPPHYMLANTQKLLRVELKWVATGCGVMMKLLDFRSLRGLLRCHLSDVGPHTLSNPLWTCI